MKVLMKNTVIFSELSKFSLSKFSLMPSIIPYMRSLFNEIIQFIFNFSKFFFAK